MSCRLVLGCVSVLIGIVASLPAQGLIPFTPPICTTLPAGFVLYRDSADFDGDGDLDLLGRPVTQSSTIQVLLQDQNGQLQLGPSSASSAVSNMHASFGDLNGDGFMDVCTFSTNGGLSFLFQTPSGFNRVDRAAPFVNINQLQILDWNGDGSPDIVLGRKQVLINAGNGSFPTQVTIGPPSYIGDGFTDFVDLDGDGDFDILQTNGNPALSIAGAFPFTVHLADPSGALTSQTLITETALSMAMGSGDFDGDGDGDLVQIGEFPGSGGGAEIRLRTWLRDPAGNYAPGAWQGVVNVTSSPLAVSGWPLAIVDFDGDGFDDIAVLFAEAFQWQVKIYRGSPSGFLAPAQVQSTAVDNNFIYMADFDQDGRQDLGWAGQSGFCRALNL
ncbi:MAG: VCBS repeat-containing protein, partial [Planctomycetes bacterium]|nr:VCBS repeat-containing protein [Planctomycetota bacterium]